MRAERRAHEVDEVAMSRVVDACRPPMGPGQRLLLVAPPGLAREALSQALEGAYDLIDVASDDAEARAHAAGGREPPGAVVLVVGRTLAPSWRVLEWLRLQPRFDRVPVVLVGAGEAQEAIVSLAEPCVALPHDVPLVEVRSALVAVRDRARPILVVDDDPDYASATVHLLEQAGYRAEAAGSAREAIEFLERTDAAAVLLDRSMPAVDGTEVFGWIRAQRRFVRLPVVFVSGDRPPSRLQQMNHDRAYWLTKPVSPALLLKVVREHVAG